ncbi:MAG: hypothetical protein JWP11_483 [Frankiales bacterium]|nr:hypothetical protein [Frankiales bacterium]
MPDETDPPGGDWSFPAVDPPSDALLGWTPEPALPADPAPCQPAYLPVAMATPPTDPLAEEPPLAADPAPVELPALLLPDATGPAVPGAPANGGAEEPPSAGVLPVPRRHPAEGVPVSPVRALAGAAVAVAGVLLGIGALLWATDAPKGTPALQQPQAQSSQLAPSAAPSALSSPSPEAVTVTPAPLQSRAVVAAPAAAPKLPLTVLNNSNVNQLAKRAAARYQAGGWPIKLTGAFRGRIPVTTVYYEPGQQASAVALQKQFPAIERVRPRFAGLPGSGLTVVLTRTYPA